MFKKVSIIVIAALVLGGCNIFPGNETKTNSLDVTMGTPTQKLVITSGNNRHEFEVEIASTDQQRKIGLMNRRFMDNNRGMLFIFNTQGYVNFWMKNTFIPLDIIYINDQSIIEHISKNAQPCTAARDIDCQKYNSEKPVKYVLEINGGLADEKAIRVGDKVNWL